MVNDVNVWAQAINLSRDSERADNAEFFKQNAPLEEVQITQDEETFTIGIFDINNQMFWSKRLPNGTYKRYELIIVPKEVCLFIKEYFSKC